MWPNTRSKTSIGTSRRGTDRKRWERIIEQEVSGRVPRVRGVIGELRRLHRHIWIAWILIVGVAAAFLVLMQP